MRERVCKNCGGRQYVVVGQNMVKCQFCGTLYVDEHASKEEEVLVVKAYEKLRDFKFEEAIDEFDKVLTLYPLSFEAFYGKCLAKNKIIFYTEKKGITKKPKFFGNTIPSILNDEDFKSAVENAPAETAKTYNEQAKRIEKIHTAFENLSKENSTDIFVSAISFDKESDQKISDAIKALNGQNLKYYFSLEQESKEKEEETFKALHDCKVMVLFANEKKGYLNGENKNLYDRYLYLISQRKKAKQSFIIVLDDESVSLEDLPKELSVCKNVININSENFLQEFVSKIKKEINNTVEEIAKIETVDIKKIKPKKKEYVDVESIEPNELGHYHVENVELSEANKIKWIFLSLKNGDFGSAKDLISTELSKDPNNAELIWAGLLCENKLKTQEEFFSSIANFRDKDKIDRILELASKDFAESFVDKWEELIISLDSEEYYNAFLLYLAKFNTPNRENFVSKAEQKAVETLDEELIDKVLKCFNSNEVDRFIDFYFMLAQKSDNQEYYQKVLDIDEGHEQSNLAILLQHFKTDEDKLTYRNQSDIEEVFKFLSENTRSQFVMAVANMILPVAFKNLKQAEQQLDFYLAYVSDEKQLVKILKNIALKFQEMGYFKQAEKYVSIAISKDKNQAYLYWLLIQIKAHCTVDNELIKSNVKISQMPEWETLISIASEKEIEKYAEIVSRANLYSGKKMEYKEDSPDIDSLILKLNEFLLRNNKILLECEKEETGKVTRGANYFKLQLKPFEKYAEELKTVKSYKEFKELIEKIETRLDLLDLNLDSSINVTHLIDKDKNIQPLKVEAIKKEKVYEKTKKTIKKDVFLKRFLFLFLELFPLLFTTLLLIIVIVLPKEVYLYFSQDFMIITIVLSIAIGLANLVAFTSKRMLSRGWKTATLSLFCIGCLNLLLLCMGFYLMPKTISINDAREFDILLHNARYASFELNSDIDMSKISWRGGNFTGVLDGNGHKLENLSFAKTNECGLFKRNSGEIKNLEIYLSEETYDNVTNFGVVAIRSDGKIENCMVYGTLNLNSSKDAVIGGLVGSLEGGSLKNCISSLKLTLLAENNEIVLGGLIGQAVTGKNQTEITQNTNQSIVDINSSSSQIITVGGLVGNLGKIKNLNISTNCSNTNITISGNANNIVAGGLIGVGYSESENNYSLGKIDVSALESDGLIGGLYGEYVNSDRTKVVSHSYSSIEFDKNSTIKFGGLVGGLGGNVNSCYTTQDVALYGQKESSFADMANCDKLLTKFYDEKFGFDEEIWVILPSEYPYFR